MVDMKHGKVYTPACMPASGVDFTGETAWVYGWGKTDMFSDYNADTLRCIGIWVYGYMGVWLGQHRDVFKQQCRHSQVLHPTKGDTFWL